MSSLSPAAVSHLTTGRAQIGTSLSFHLFFAVLGVGLPLMMLVAEGMHLRTPDHAAWMSELVAGALLAVLGAAAGLGARLRYRLRDVRRRRTAAGGAATLGPARPDQ
jgi:hypothetical protein